LARRLSLYRLWERAFTNPSESFQSSARGLQKAFHRLQKISILFPESRIINGLLASRGKKIVARRRSADMGPRAALADGSYAR
jgi:hypothetical protein